MDSLTQIVLGAAVGEAVAGRKMGAKAALWGAVGGTIPDLDVFFIRFWHPIDASLVHRGFSHSLLFSLLAGPFFGWLFFRLYKRKYALAPWIRLFFLSIITHPLLDMFTNYGTSFLWPLDLRITFNSVFVIDPLYTAPFMICLLVALFKRRESVARRRWNYAGILWSSLYLLWGVAVKLAILGNATEYFARSGVQARNTIVTPMPLTSFYWLMITEDDRNIYVGYKSLFYDFQPDQVETIPKNHAMLDSIRWPGENYTQKIRYISNGYYAVSKSGDTLRVRDLRFGTTTPLTNGKVRAPLMGYDLVTDKGIVQKTIPARGSGAFKALNFAAYYHRIFHK